MTATGFVNRTQNLIEQEIEPITGWPSYTNLTSARTKGIEFELGAKWPGGLDGAISYSLQDSRNVATGDVLTNSPRQLAKINVSVPVLPTKLFASVDAQYVSGRQTVVRTELGGFVVVNMTLFARQLGESCDVSGSLYNVFDRHYADSGSLEHLQASIPQDGRSARITVTYRLHQRAR